MVVHATFSSESLGYPCNSITYASALCLEEQCCTRGTTTRELSQFRDRDPRGSIYQLHQALSQNRWHTAHPEPPKSHRTRLVEAHTRAVVVAPDASLCDRHGTYASTPYTHLGRPRDEPSAALRSSPDSLPDRPCQTQPCDQETSHTTPSLQRGHGRGWPHASASFAQRSFFSALLRSASISISSESAQAE